MEDGKYGKLSCLSNATLIHIDRNVVDGSIWFYAPAKPAPIIFATLFLISGLLHFYQCQYVVFLYLLLTAI